MTKIAAVITTLGITYSCCHALSIPSTRLASSPLSTQSLTATSNKESALFMAPQIPPQQPRRPRRMLKKRTTKEGDGRRRKRNRRNRHAETAASFETILPGILSNNGNSDENVALNDGSNSNRRMINSINNNYNDRLAVTQDYRPLVPSVRRDMGEDYWIDPKDLERERRKEEQEQQRRIAFGTKSDTDQAMSQEKLMTEVKAPYRQNWIGYFSLMVAVLSIIVSQFPELLEPTQIRLPDL